MHVMWMFVYLNQSNQNVFELLEINKLEAGALLLLFSHVSVCQRPRHVYRISWVCKVCKRSIRMCWKK